MSGFSVHDKGEIMWPELKARLKATQGDQQMMQIHQEPLFNHQVDHADAETILSAARFEFTSIQCIQAYPEHSPSSKEDLDPKAPSTPTLNSHVLQNLIEDDWSPIYDEYTDWCNEKAVDSQMFQNLIREN